MPIPRPTPKAIRSDGDIPPWFLQLTQMVFPPLSDPPLPPPEPELPVPMLILVPPFGVGVGAELSELDGEDAGAADVTLRADTEVEAEDPAAVVVSGIALESIGLEIEVDH